ncbi:PREDICTED: uncharacterized protein LOC105507765 [Colobus angolensis palliatus]|uniref:uncharacterized protein LOC105507765 n=1 Tax=Colobus angolensis palliatus TaxID=336983 RepID=UPI0005F52F80|nr:PREDICTED: uncharacterized protein LOC105507765 [Colobus angolensis palliatus]
MYIQGVLLALYQRLKSTKKYCKQLNLAMNEQKEKITEKVILSMTAKEHHKEHEEVSRLIDELQTAIKSNRGHLSKLGPQLQAEQEQFSSYVYQHIKSLPANTLVPGGLQLKVFENGKNTGEISVGIRKKDLGSDSPIQTAHMMERLLLKIHQRLQGSSINPPGLNFSSMRLFDENGQEIKNPLSLKNEQKIWVSYGRAYRPPLNLALGLTFDRVSAFARGDIMVAYKTFLDPNAVLLPGCWEVCEGFPINFNCTSQQIPDQFEKVDLENHFLQNKAYPQFVLTYLEELNAQVDVTQTEYHIHHGAWTTAHQEHGRNLAEEVLQESASNPGLKQLPEPSDTHLMPEGSLEEIGQLTVALVRKLEEKHPKASAQRWAIKHEGTSKPGQWKHSRVENPLWNKLTYMWPVLPSGQLNEVVLLSLRDGH